MKKNVFITGGVGFLGVHLTRRLLKQGYSVTLYDTAPLDAKDLFSKVTYLQGDIRDTKKITAAIKGHDYVVHAAAALPIVVEKDIIYSVNIDGTESVLKASLKNKVQRLVFISSTAVYGVPKHLPEKETSPLDPIGYYGESKVAGENLCLEYEKKGLEINIIRPKTFLGPERLGVFELWFEAIYLDKRVFILGNGHNRYQLLAVGDVASAVQKALTTKKHGEIFNIGAKNFGTWREDLGYVIKNAQSKSIITSLPLLPSQLLLETLEYFKLSPIAKWHYKTIAVPSYVSTKKAESVLRWKATQSNKELLLESYLWYKNNRSHIINKIGTTHRVGWNFKALNIIRKFF